MNTDGGVWGSYLHGIFENAGLRRAWLRSLGWRGEASSALPSFETALDELADAMEAALDMEYLDRLISEQTSFA
jgi:adenosylcobyric acid synthase